MYFSLCFFSRCSDYSLHFFLGEQPDSLQLLQRRDPVLNPLLHQIRHFITTLYSQTETFI